jgi:hypothetical protein
MKRNTFFVGLCCLLFQAILASCNSTVAKNEKPLSGSWRLDSVTHPRDSNRAALAGLAFVLAAGEGPVHYSFTQDSIHIYSTSGPVDSIAFTRNGDTLRLRDSGNESLLVGRPADSLLTLTFPDSLQVHLTRLR